MVVYDIIHAKLINSIIKSLHSYKYSSNFHTHGSIPQRNLNITYQSINVEYFA